MKTSAIKWTKLQFIDSDGGLVTYLEDCEKYVILARELNESGCVCGYFVQILGHDSESADWDTGPAVTEIDFTGLN